MRERLLVPHSNFVEPYYCKFHVINRRSAYRLFYCDLTVFLLSAFFLVHVGFGSLGIVAYCIYVLLSSVCVLYFLWTLLNLCRAGQKVPCDLQFLLLLYVVEVASCGFFAFHGLSGRSSAGSGFEGVYEVDRLSQMHNLIDFLLLCGLGMYLNFLRLSRQIHFQLVAFYLGLFIIAAASLFVFYSYHGLVFAKIIISVQLLAMKFMTWECCFNCIDRPLSNLTYPENKISVFIYHLALRILALLSLLCYTPLSTPYTGVLASFNRLWYLSSLLYPLQPLCKTEAARLKESLQECIQRFRLDFCLKAFDLSNAVYEDLETISDDATDTHFAIHLDGMVCFVAFRGTWSWTNIGTDLNVAHRSFDAKEKLGHFGREVCVHSGFAHAYLSVRDRVLKEIGRHEQNCLHIVVCGHSMGGSLAQLLALDIVSHLKDSHLRIHCYTFGQPRCGDPAFAELFNESVPDGFRIVNAQDMASNLPLANVGYKHTRREIHIDRQGNAQFEMGYFMKSILPSRNSVYDHPTVNYRETLSAFYQNLMGMDYDFTLSAAFAGCKKLEDDKVPPFNTEIV